MKMMISPEFRVLSPDSQHSALSTQDYFHHEDTKDTKIR